jgi:hypothetical protein
MKRHQSVILLWAMALALTGVVAGCGAGGNDGQTGSSTDTGGVSSAMTVTFDPSSGSGFVGKGDVQTAFGFNNQQLQSNASGLSFSYIAEQTYEGVCEWTTGEGTRGQQTHDVTHQKSSTINAAIAFDARAKNQISGFILNGFSSTTEEGSVPAVGDPCPGNPGNDAVWVSIDLLSSTGGLYVNLGGNSVMIWQQL